MEEVQDSDNLSSVETEDTEVDLCDDMLLSFLTSSDLEFFPAMSPEETELDLHGLAEKYDLRLGDPPRTQIAY